MNEPLVEWLAAGRALLWIYYNQRTDCVLRAAYPRWDEMDADYQAEKRQSWRDTPLLFFAHLDAEGAVSFMLWAMEMYGDDAVQQADLSVAATRLHGRKPVA